MVKVKFLGKENEKMNAGGCSFKGSDSGTHIQEVGDETAEYMVNTWPDYFEIAGVKKVDHKIPHLKKDVKAESYETKDIKVSEETKSEVIGEQVVVEKSAPKKSTPKKKGKR